MRKFLDEAAVGRASRISRDKLSPEVEIARENRAHLRAANVAAVNLIGGMGCGKTSLIDAAAKLLGPLYRIAVITGDPFPATHGLKLSDSKDSVVRIDPGAEAQLKPSQIRAALNKLDLAKLDIVFIESASGLEGPSGVDLGETERVVVFSVAAGERRPSGFSSAVRTADLVVLNKIDMLSVMPFDRVAFRREVRHANPSAPVLELSTSTSEGIARWEGWLKRIVKAKGATSAPLREFTA